jgi:hypothetical protein
MPVPSLLVVAVWCLPVPDGEVQRKAVSSGVIVMPYRDRINLPILLEPKAREQTARICLFVSTDRGRTWKIDQEKDGRWVLFAFKPRGEGEYWFSVQIIEKSGRRHPEDVAKEEPSLKVLLQNDPKMGKEIEPPRLPEPLPEPLLKELLQNDPKMGKERVPPRLLEALTDPVEQIEEFFSRYHARPSPDRVCHFLDLALTKDVLQHPAVSLWPHTRDLFSHGFGNMARENPKLVRQIEARFAKTAGTGRTVLLRCLRICGDDETVKTLAAWRDDPRYADDLAYIETVRKSLTDPRRKRPRDLPAKTPEELDYLWADFFVSGEYAPVARILDVLDEPKHPAILRKVAEWSLRSNLEQHPRLAELFRAHQRDRPEPTRQLIRGWLEETKK